MISFWAVLLCFRTFRKLWVFFGKIRMYYIYNIWAAISVFGGRNRNNCRIMGGTWWLALPAVSWFLLQRIVVYKSLFTGYIEQMLLFWESQSLMRQSQLSGGKPWLIYSSAWCCLSKLHASRFVYTVPSLQALYIYQNDYLDERECCTTQNLQKLATSPQFGS